MFCNDSLLLVQYSGKVLNTKVFVFQQNKIIEPQDPFNILKNQKTKSNHDM